MYTAQLPLPHGPQGYEGDQGCIFLTLNAYQVTFIKWYLVIQMQELEI